MKSEESAKKRIVTKNLKYTKKIQIKMTSAEDKQPLLDKIDPEHANDTAINIPKEEPVKLEAANTRNKINMKYISLVLLVVQNASLVLLTRYAKTRTGDQFVSTTAVVMSEFLKLLACLVITFFEMNRNVKAWMAHLNDYLLVNWVDTLKVAVPAFIYMIQNNLAYVAIGNLPAATFQVSYQLKLLTTAIFSVVMLGKSLVSRQWLSLFLLFAGVSIVQVNGTKEASTESIEQSQLIGMTAVLLACCSSGFAGVYFEKILKGTKASLWTRNIQLGLFGFLTGLIGAYAKDGDKIHQNGGFFFGYTPIVWSVICCQAFGGLLVAVVIKYADNILKGFACSISIIVSAIVAYFIFEFQITGMFVIGTIFVCAAVYLYSLPNQK